MSFLFFLIALPSIGIILLVWACILKRRGVPIDLGFVLAGSFLYLFFEGGSIIALGWSGGIEGEIFVVVFPVIYIITFFMYVHYVKEKISPTPFRPAGIVKKLLILILILMATAVLLFVSSRLIVDILK